MFYYNLLQSLKKDVIVIKSQVIPDDHKNKPVLYRWWKIEADLSLADTCPEASICKINSDTYPT